MNFQILLNILLAYKFLFCRCKKRKQEKEREDYRYSGSDNDDEEPQIAGEPSSIIQQPGGDTLRRNFQQIQEGRTLSQNVEQQQAAAAAGRNQKPLPPQQQPPQQLPQRNEKPQPVEEPGPPSRPALPHRLIVVPDPPQHANRPLPPTPRSAPTSSQSQQPAPQQPQRNSQNIFKPMVSLTLLVVVVGLLPPITLLISLKFSLLTCCYFPEYFLSCSRNTIYTNTSHQPNKITSMYCGYVVAVSCVLSRCIRSPNNAFQINFTTCLLPLLLPLLLLLPTLQQTLQHITHNKTIEINVKCRFTLTPQFDLFWFSMLYGFTDL